MADEKTLKAIQADIEDELGMDVYRVVPEDERRFIGEALVVAAVTALLIDYLKGFLHPTDVGKANRSALDALLDRVRRHDAPAEDLTSELEGEAMKALDEAQAATGDRTAAKAKLVEGLRGLELPEAEATDLATRLSAGIERHLAQAKAP